MLKTLLAEVRQYKKASVLAPLFMVGEVVMEISIPMMMAQLIDNGVDKGDFRSVCVTGAIMAAMAFISLACGVLSGKYAALASSGFAHNLRQAMFRNIQTFSFANLDKYSTAGLVTRMTTDVTNVQNAYQMVLRMCIRAPLMLICAMAAAMFISLRMSMIFVAALLLLGVALFFITTHAYPLFNQVFRRYDNLNASVQENVSAIRVVKAYVREGHETEKFHTANDNVYRLFISAEKLITLNGPVMQFTMYGCILAISWLGAHMISAGALTTGNLMSLFTYVMNILMSLMMLSMIFVMLTMSRASMDRIAEVLEEKADLVSPAAAETTVADGSIDLDHVSFAYGEGKPVLRDIDLHIRSGETIGIIGGTGSAKTSLVQLIPRLYDITEGTVRVGGRDVREYDLDTLRSAVAMVLQKNVLFSGTIKENLRWGDKYATDEELVHACKLAQADEFIQTLPEGYDTYIEQGGTNVSGGQKQRLCIARALVKKPKILILDDSTSAVDTRTDALIRDAFAKELPETTKLIIAQRISSVQAADKILVLDEGRIAAFGTHDELLKTSEIYRDVYESQQKGADDDAATGRA
ncbi:MAG: ABC transporter ATP-binding protein [Subdoligranulum sp.]|nr:ABC transporter ATP-binding protein [Subdoligranulum sp.]